MYGKNNNYNETAELSYWEFPGSDGYFLKINYSRRKNDFVRVSYYNNQQNIEKIKEVIDNRGIEKIIAKDRESKKLLASLKAILAVA